MTRNWKQDVMKHRHSKKREGRLGASHHSPWHRPNRSLTSICPHQIGRHTSNQTPSNTEESAPWVSFKLRENSHICTHTHTRTHARTHKKTILRSADCSLYFENSKNNKIVPVVDESRGFYGLHLKSPNVQMSKQCPLVEEHRHSHYYTFLFLGD